MLPELNLQLGLEQLFELRKLESDLTVRKERCVGVEDLEAFNQDLIELMLSLIKQKMVYQKAFIDLTRHATTEDAESLQNWLAQRKGQQADSELPPV